MELIRPEDENTQHQFLLKYFKRNKNFISAYNRMVIQINELCKNCPEEIFNAQNDDENKMHFGINGAYLPNKKIESNILEIISKELGPFGIIDKITN